MLLFIIKDQNMCLFFKKILSFKFFIVLIFFVIKKQFEDLRLDLEKQKSSFFKKNVYNIFIPTKERMMWIL